MRTNAVTTVHLRTLKPAAAAAEEGGGVERDSLEKVDVLPAAIGKHRRSGVNRPVDGPLPSLVVWVETDNETPFTPPTDSINLDISSSGSSGLVLRCGEALSCLTVWGGYLVVVLSARSR